MRFEIYKSKDYQYFFVIRSIANGQIVATSETYTAKSSAEKTIESMKRRINSSTQVIDKT